jgi:hypothetical protein
MEGVASRDSLTGCIPGDWSCQCPYCGYGDTMIIGTSIHILQMHLESYMQGFL